MMNVHRIIGRGIAGLLLVAGAAPMCVMSGCATAPTHEESVDTHARALAGVRRVYQDLMESCASMDGAAHDQCELRAQIFLTQATNLINSAFLAAEQNRFEDARTSRKNLQRTIEQLIERFPSLRPQVERQFEPLRDSLNTIIQIDIGLDRLQPERDTEIIAGIGCSGGALRGGGNGRPVRPIAAFTFARGGQVVSPLWSGSFAIEGSLSLYQDPTVASGRTVYEVHALAARVSAPGVTLTLANDSAWGLSTLTIGADGGGVLHLLTSASFSDPMLAYLYPGMLALDLPVRRDGEGYRIDTGPDGLPLYSLAPLADYPVSDYNRDGALSEADVEAFMVDWAAGVGSLTDLNGDGVRDLTDVAIFDECFQFDLTRPR